MKPTIVAEGQALIDITMQETGGIESLFVIANINGRSITDDLNIGEVLIASDVLNPLVVAQFLPRYRKPVSGETFLDDDSEGLEGIGYWAIGSDFIVS